MTCIIMLGMLCFVMSDALLICPPSSQGSAIKRLKSSLLCDYEKYERPIKNRENVVLIRFKLLLKYISFLDYQNKYELSAFFWMSWTDEFLTWEPKDYDNIDQIWISSNDIWVLDVSSMHTDTKQLEIRDENESSCRVSSKGQVTCAPQVNTIAYCRQKLTHWPYDQQNCTFSIISYGYNAHEVDFKAENESYKSNNPSKSNDWDVISSSPSTITATYTFIVENVTKTETYSHREYKFQFKRHADLQAVVVITTAFAMSALTLISFWIHGVENRACLCCTSIIGHLLCLLYIASKINASGTSTPNIAIFQRDAMLMTLFAMVFGVFVERVRDRTSKIQAPLWLMNCVSWLKRNGGKLGQLLLGQEDTEVTDVDNDKNTSTYNIYVNFLNRITFLVLLIIYSIVLAALLP